MGRRYFAVSERFQRVDRIDTKIRLLTSSRPRPPKRISFQLVGDLVDPGLGADLVLVAAGRPGNADRADDFVADLDGQRPLRGDHVVQVHGEEGWVLLVSVGDLARGDAEGARGIGLAKAVLERVRRGIVAAQLDNDLAVAADDSD